MEVRRGPLRSRAGSGGPARPAAIRAGRGGPAKITAIKSWQMRSGEEGGRGEQLEGGAVHLT